MADDQNCVAELENVDSSSEDSVDAKPDRTSIISSIMRYVFFLAVAITPQPCGPNSHLLSPPTYGEGAFSKGGLCYVCVCVCAWGWSAYRDSVA